jgi:Holliday junction DNA helicase RuvA
MIGHLRGTLVEKRPNLAVVDVAGVGYRVHIPLSTFYELGEINGPVTLLTHTHVREDQLALYGFLSAREQQIFEMLLSASGVGPSLALKILSGLPIEELAPAIRAGNLEQLLRIPGVGRKTAERIVVELRDKMAAVAPEAAADGAAPRTGMEADLVSALTNLGYDARTSERAVAAAMKNGAGRGESFEALLRASLAQVAAAGK